MTYAELQDQLTAALAGPAAERLRFPEVSSGDESDIRAATALAEAMVKRYGMSRRLGPVALSSQPSRDYSDSTARLVDDEIRALIDRANTLAVRILRAHRAGLDRLAARLLVEETVEGDALDEILTPNAA
jgi:cell division protease FtsH